MRRVTGIVLCVVLCLIVSACSSGKVGKVEPDNKPAGNSDAGAYDYKVNDDKESVTIEKYKDSGDVVSIPAEIDGYRVTAIGAEAFRYRKLKSVSFPDGISSIGEQAFEYCQIAETLVLPANVTVERSAFSYSEVLERVVIESGAVIKSGAFGYCDDLIAVVCGDGSSLENNAFEYCPGMEEAYLCGDVSTEEGSFIRCGDIELVKTEAAEYDNLKKSALDGSLGGHEDSYPEEEKDLEIKDSPASLDGVTVTLEKAAAQRTDAAGYDYTLSGTIENTTDEGIMEVIYTFTLIDEKGEEYRSFSITYDGEDTALQPHAKTEFLHDHIRWGKQSVPAAVRIAVSSVKTEKELPPAHVPRKGEYLYQALDDEKLANIKEEPPVELSFHVDQGGFGRTAVFKEGEELDRAVELLCAIKIGEESGEWVTDNYNGISLTWKDGSYTGISLNLTNLEYWVHTTPHTYELDNLGEFWSYCEGYLREDEQ